MFFCPRCNEELSESERRKYGVCYECLNDSILESTGGTFQPLMKRTVTPNPERLRKKEQQVHKKANREIKESLFSGNKDEKKKDDPKPSYNRRHG